MHKLPEGFLSVETKTWVYFWDAHHCCPSYLFPLATAFWVEDLVCIRRVKAARNSLGREETCDLRDHSPWVKQPGIRAELWFFAAVVWKGLTLASVIQPYHASCWLGDPITMIFHCCDMWPAPQPETVAAQQMLALPSSWRCCCSWGSLVWMWERAHRVRHEDREMEKAGNCIHYYRLHMGRVLMWYPRQVKDSYPFKMML